MNPYERYVRYFGPVIHEDKEYSDAINELDRKAQLIKEHIESGKAFPNV